MKSLFDRVQAATDMSDFDALSTEEKKKIKKWLLQIKISTLSEAMHFGENDTTPNWRKQMTKWINELVCLYEKTYINEKKEERKNEYYRY